MNEVTLNDEETFELYDGEQEESENENRNDDVITESIIRKNSNYLLLCK